MLRIGCALHSLRAVPRRRDARRAGRVAGDIRRCTSTSPSRSAKCRTASHMRGARAGRMAARQCRGRCALDAGARHAPRPMRKCRASPRSGATVAICPTTEANLGDGLFPLRAYLDAGGALGHRFGFADLGVAGRGTALARIRPAPGHAPSQHRRARRHRAASAKPAARRARQRRERHRPRHRRSRRRRAPTGSCSTPMRRIRRHDRATTRSTAGSSAATATWCAMCTSAAGRSSPMAGTATAMRSRGAIRCTRSRAA